MFGMSGKEFWEDDPQLYWSYRTFYLKKMELETERLNYENWLNGSYTYLAVSIALNNSFSKNKIDYPNKPLGTEKQKAKTELQKILEKEKDKDVRQQIEFNYWARL